VVNEAASLDLEQSLNALAVNKNEEYCRPSIGLLSFAFPLQQAVRTSY
jgi:hypothetical protein